MCLSISFTLISSSAFCQIKRDRYRTSIDFNLDWLFEQDDWVGLNNASQPDWNDKNWQKIRLPHSWNMDDTFDPVRGYYRGFSWYRKHFGIDEKLSGKMIYLRFGAIYTHAEIFVNGIYFGPFDTGYTPIEIEITDALKWNEENLIAVRVNNIHNDEIPPGRWRMDYNCYGGIYREVELIAVQPVHLLENTFFVTTPVVNSKLSELAVQISVKNNSLQTGFTKVSCQLFDGETFITEFSQIIRVPAGLTVELKDLTAKVNNVRLWSPEMPCLYTVRLTLYENEQPVDDLWTQIGFRSFYFDAEKGLFINGKPLKLQGLNRHQCYPGLANAVPERLQIEDAKILKELGANFVRCSHYPQHPAFLNACDRLGLLVYEEVASWQHIGGDVFIQNMNQMLEEMIRRDRNHPSIILWGLMNEGRSVKMFEKLQETARRLDPTRPTCYAENHLNVAVQSGTAFIPDVLGLNYDIEKYNQFHQDFPHLKLVNSECTNPDVAVFGNTENEIQGVLKIKNDLDLMEKMPFLGGVCIWSFHDYGSEYKPVWPIQKSGVVDIYRRFKEAAYYLQSRWRSEPYVHIAGHWTWPGEESKIKEVYIWHNCEKIGLYLNGKELKIHPTSEFRWQVPFQPGELKVIGKKGNSTVTHHVITADVPEKIALIPLMDGPKSDGYDAIPFEARILDKNNIQVPVNGVNIDFEVSGPGKLIGIGGANSALSAKGSVVMLVQSTQEPGPILITAKSEGLISGICQIMSKK
jgi:beta-galactosidase